MNHNDTLKIYHQLMNKGLTAEQAEIHIAALQVAADSMLNWLKELASEFASQKLISILGGLILLVGISSIGMLWKMSVDVELLKMNMSYLMSKQK